MKASKIKVVHVGVSGIPYAINASINRCLSIYSILSNDKFDKYVINHRAIDPMLILSDVEKSGVYQGLKYKFTCIYPLKPKRFLLRRINNASGRLNEFLKILYKSFKKEIDILIFYPTGNFFELLYYKFFAFLFRYPLIVHYVEFRSGFESRNKTLKKISDNLFDYFVPFFADGIIPISDFLINKLQAKKKNITYLKIPPVTDFSKFILNERVCNKTQKKYFLFVGSTGYFEVIEFILESFEKIQNNDFLLYLVLNGDINRISQRIKKSTKQQFIKIFTQLDQYELISMYMNAKALLIPLRNNDQDNARFPQKISEYLASGNPILTTKVGEISSYFENYKNAIIVNEYDINSFSKGMKFIIENPKKSEVIGKNGYELGLKYFDKNVYTDKLYDFLIKFIQHR